MRVEVVCMGETMALVAPDPPRPLSDARQLVLGQAGAESNVAISLVRLGTRAQWCGRLGDDALGRRVLTNIAALGLDTELVMIDAGLPTGVMFKDPGMRGTAVWYYRAGSAASTMNASDVERALAVRPRILHLTGITPALSASCSDAVDFALEHATDAGVELSFDVNYRPVLWPDRDAAARRLRSIAQGAGTVFVGVDEAEQLWGARTPVEVRAVLDGPHTVVVKDGDRSAYGFERNGCVEVPALATDVLEPVGAGDAFAAGWLHAYLRGRGAIERLRLGHLVAAAALGSVTDHGILTANLPELARADAPWPPTTESR